MPPLKTRHLFISHSWSYSDQYQRLLRLLGEEPRFFYKNYSIPKDDPIHNATNWQDLRQAIKQKMGYCDVILIMAGVYSTYSKWINTEIAIAH